MKKEIGNSPKKYNGGITDSAYFANISLYTKKYVKRRFNNALQILLHTSVRTGIYVYYLLV